MLYSPQSDPPLSRLRCRSPRCAGTLKTPAANPRDAFCRPSCERAFYGCRCRVCESLFTRKTKRRQVCWRTKCRYQFQHHPEDFFGSRYSYSPIAHNEEKTSTKSIVKNGAKSGRAYRIIAGPAADPINFRNWPELPPRTTLIKRSTPPVNVIGGYRFPGAPQIDLGRDPPHQEPESTP
jgi:hypothetical protein